MTLVRKQIIAGRFGAAATDYEDGAPLQADIAQALARRIAALSLPDTPRVLELGCGPGGLTRKLGATLADAHITVTDISPAMVSACRAGGNLPARQAQYLVMDGEHPATNGPFDLITASMVFQWFEDLGGGISALTNLLAPGGVLAFTTLAAETFHQWRRAHEAEGFEPGTPVYPTCAEIQTLWPRFGTGYVEETRVNASFANAETFALNLRQIGAQTPLPDHRPLSPGAFRRVAKRLRRDGETAMTYHVATGIFTRETA